MNIIEKMKNYQCVFLPWEEDYRQGFLAGQKAMIDFVERQLPPDSPKVKKWNWHFSYNAIIYRVTYEELKKMVGECAYKWERIEGSEVEI